ncbi:hypothetical protein NI18_06450 [Sphingomonas sp. Ant20]|nr:hypothetical protein NI18_06450 [Sphingomonas sp. Ant20]
MDRLSHIEFDRRLNRLLSDPLPMRELALWLAMSKRQREVAMRRMDALAGWKPEEGSGEPAAAAAAAGLKKNHSYEMAKAWRAAPSLASVEVLTAAPRARVSDYDHAVGAHVTTAFDEVSANGGIVISEVVERLAVLAAADLGQIPSFATLRRKVLEEQRRRERRTRPGVHLNFDCCAFTMANLDRPERTAFAIVDRRTQLVLGAALGDARRAGHGYGLAAGDALRRIGTGSLKEVAWAERLEQTELVTGLDDGLLKIGVEAAWAELPVVQPAGKPGRYLRRAAGDRMGRMLFLSADRLAKSTGGDAQEAEDAVDDAARLQVEVEIHNAAILPDLEGDPASGPSAGLIAALEFFARRPHHRPSEQPEPA